MPDEEFSKSPAKRPHSMMRKTEEAKEEGEENEKIVESPFSISQENQTKSQQGLEIATSKNNKIPDTELCKDLKKHTHLSSTSVPEETETKTSEYCMGFMRTQFKGHHSSQVGTATEEIIEISSEASEMPTSDFPSGTSYFPMHGTEDELGVMHRRCHSLAEVTKHVASRSQNISEDTETLTGSTSSRPESQAKNVEMQIGDYVYSKRTVHPQTYEAESVNTNNRPRNTFFRRLRLRLCKMLWNFCNIFGMATQETRTETPESSVTVSVATSDLNYPLPFQSMHDKTMSNRVYVSFASDKETVVLDLGTGYLKAGFSKEKRPSCVIPCLAGKRDLKSPQSKQRKISSFVGRQTLLEKTRPLKHGIVTDWESLKDLLNYVFKQNLTISVEEHAVLVSDPPMSPVKNREKCAEMMFEDFCIPAMCIAYQPALSLFSCGTTTGVVVDSGYGVSHSVPIYDGHYMPSNVVRAHYAGQNLNEYLLSLLKQSNQGFKSAMQDVVEDIKQKYCYISLNVEHEMKTPSKYQMEYKLPDGQLITLGSERFQCPEAMFNPKMMGSEDLGLHMMALKSFSRFEVNIRKELMKNFVICGGSTMFQGFPERFEHELAMMALDGTPGVVALPDRNSASWIGGSVLASLQEFQPFWIHKREYEECGPFVLHQKYF
ncbi:actin-1-like [Polypterus senegalus]|nr:actin-1-like [Polypterus senegalus]